MIILEFFLCVCLYIYVMFMHCSLACLSVCKFRSFLLLNGCWNWSLNYVSICLLLVCIFNFELTFILDDRVYVPILYWFTAASPIYWVVNFDIYFFKLMLKLGFNCVSIVLFCGYIRTYSMSIIFCLKINTRLGLFFLVKKEYDNSSGSFDYSSVSFA